MLRQHRLILTLVIVFFCLTPIWAQEDDEEEEDEPFFKNVQQRKLVTLSPNYRSILKEHSRHGTDVRQRNFLSPTLGYVTPWNSKGYEIASKFYCKFDMVSPTWFQVQYQGTSLKLNGDHDIRQSWVDGIRKADQEKVCPHRAKRDGLSAKFPNTKILPRFLIEGWGIEGYQALFAAKSPLAKKFIDLLVSTVTEHSFDGLVLDAGYLNARAPWRPNLIAVLTTLAKRLHDKNLLFVLVIPPYRGGSVEESFFNAQDFTDLHEHVDYFSLMTYDFSNVQHPGPSSPLQWSADCIRSLVPDHLKSEASHKILGGVNLYGNDFSDGGGGGAIVGDAYLKLLKAKKPKFKWDEVFAEHRFDYQQGGVSHQVWFPTLAYLQQRFEIAQSSLGTGLSFWELGQGLDYFYDLL